MYELKAREVDNRLEVLSSQVIRGYEIGERIGSGGYGAVYRAKQLSINRDVAIKVILPQYTSDPKFVADFEAEAKLVAQLEHTNIVPLHDYWQDEQGAFLVMRYVRGGSLKDILDKQGALLLTRTVRLIEEIAEALATAHDAGVVHRDLKPANILVDQRGNAYLTDFGIAKQLANDDISGESGALKGTVAYMSPEQIQGEKVSPQTDIYALGIMLYEMLAGQHPFHDTSIGTLLVKHMQEPLPDIHNVRDNLPSGINAVIQRATAKAPADRYASVLELVSDLQVAVSGVPVVVPQPATPKNKKATTVEERNRYAMLQNVGKFWIEGVLENSLHERVMIDLGMTDEMGKVDSPWDTVLRTPTGTESVNNEHAIDVFERLNGKVLILGDPGSGKTITLLTLARDLLSRAELDEHHPIPVVFNLSSWAERQLPLAMWLVEELNTRYQVPRKVGAKWVEDDALLLLLDGLDEVALEWRAACVNAINTYRSEHGFVDVVVCSRINDYEALTGQLKLNGAIVIQALDDTQIVQYLDALGDDVGVVREVITHDAQLRELAQSPLMLSIMVLAFRGQSVSDVPDFDDIEAQRHHVFDVYVERMFHRRVGARSFTLTEVKSYLGWLAGKMQEQAQSIFHIEGMQPTIIPRVERQGFYRRVRVIHIIATTLAWSLGAIFIALALNVSVVFFLLAVGLLQGAWLGWSISGNEWKTPYAPVVNGLIDGIALFAVLAETNSRAAILAGLGWGVGGAGWAVSNRYMYYANGGDKDTIALVETVKLNIGNINRLQWIGIITGGIFVAGGSVLALGIQFDLSLGNILLGWLVYSILALTVNITHSALEFGSASVRRHPNQGLKVTFYTVTLISIATAIGTVLGNIFVALVMGAPLESGLLIGLGFGISLLGYGHWTLLGGIGIYRHWMLRRTLSSHGYLPLDLAHFLDYASSLIFLRKVGGGYIFIHRYLLEYFAALEPAEDNA